MLAWVLACGGGGPEPHDRPPAATDTQTESTDTDLVVEVEIDDDKPTVVHVSVHAATGATSVVRFGLDGALDRQTPEHAGGAEVHEHLVLGGVAGRTLTLQAEATEDGQTVTSAVVDVPLAPPPDLLPVLTRTADEPGSQVDGHWVVTAGVDGRLKTAEDALFYVAIVDADGGYVWWHFLPQGWATTSGMPSVDGRTLVWAEVQNARDEPDGRIVRMSLDGEVVSTTIAPTLHHAIAELPGGGFAYLGRRFDPAPEPPGQWLTTDQVLTVPEGDDGTRAEVLFDYVDDWWGGSLDGFWLEPCDVVIPSLFGYDDVCDLVHTNSLVYEPVQDRLYLGARILDTVLAVDAPSGDLVWQLGGVGSEFRYATGDPIYEGRDASHLWSQPHFSHVWPGGLVMFDNGMFHETQTSSVVEVAWDEGAGTVEEAFRYADPDGGYTPSLGDARKLSGGTYLASWMSLGRIDEVTADGEVVWQLDTSGIAVRRVHLLEDLYDLTETGVGLRR